VPHNAQSTDSPAPGPLVFRVRHRLTHAREFQAVYGAKLRRSLGPFSVFLKANGLPHPRLGLSIGRVVGPAVVRSRLKRMIREAFRLNLASLPVRDGSSYDIVVTARAHDPMSLDEYARALLDMARAGDREWAKRHAPPKPQGHDHG